MDKQMTMTDAESMSWRRYGKEKEFLAQIERIVPMEGMAYADPAVLFKGERGNKPYPLETMLRLYLLQNLYDQR